MREVGVQGPGMAVVVTGFTDFNPAGGGCLAGTCSTSTEVKAEAEPVPCTSNPACLLLDGLPDGVPRTHRVPLDATWDAHEQLHRARVSRTEWHGRRRLVLVHLGLGVYGEDARHCLLECGAYNHRNGTRDVRGVAQHGRIRATRGEQEEEEEQEEETFPMRERCAGLERCYEDILRNYAAGVGGSDEEDAHAPRTHYALHPAPARRANTYVCNRLHWESLERVAAGEYAAAFFVHVPKPETQEAARALQACVNRVVTLCARAACRHCTPSESEHVPGLDTASRRDVPGAWTPSFARVLQRILASVPRMSYPWPRSARRTGMAYAGA